AVDDDGGDVLGGPGGTAGRTEGEIEVRDQLRVDVEGERVHLRLERVEVAGGEARRLHFQLREAPLRRVGPAVELVLRLLDALRIDGRARAGRLTVAAEGRLPLVGDPLLLSGRALFHDRRPIARIQLLHDLADQGV